MKKILILNGPNLNLLGTREPEQYGATTLADVEAQCRAAGERLGYTVECFQSNWEGALIDKIHEYGRLHKAGEALGCVFNPGAYTDTAVLGVAGGGWHRDRVWGGRLPHRPGGAGTQVRRPIAEVTPAPRC